MAGLRGRVAIVLHAHLPYVLTHGTFPHGSDWVCEAVAESYLPLLGVLRRLLLRGIIPRWTIELSPVLCEQLASPRFRVLFQNYCRQKQGAARQDEEHFRATATIRSSSSLPAFGNPSTQSGCGSSPKSTAGSCLQRWSGSSALGQ
jgi:predicted glycosyl hydrolase (DUF1957 family)